MKGGVLGWEERAAGGGGAWGGHAESGLKIWVQKFQGYSITPEPAQPGFCLASGGTIFQNSKLCARKIHSNRPNPDPFLNAFAAAGIFDCTYLHPNRFQHLFFENREHVSNSYFK